MGKNDGASLDNASCCNRVRFRVMLRSPKTRLPRAIVNIENMASMMHTRGAFAYGAFEISYCEPLHLFRVIFCNT
jgi:hypothetical protein